VELLGFAPGRAEGNELTFAQTQSIDSSPTPVNHDKVRHSLHALSSPVSCQGRR